ncbi:MAG: 1-acyl-sn-glycerol-3-phosphate acyltransferase [Pontiellaceae bacterium]|nr:1-acyl-sn-glycerol-3-phosphate acyltransferase [Pontiellaceae bacterium]
MEEWSYKAAKDQDLKPGEWPRSVRRDPGLVGASSGALRWGLVRSYLRFAHRLRFEGREHIPRDMPFVLIANHASHLDALVLGAVIPVGLNHRVFPIGAGDTFFRYRTTAVLSSLFLNVLPMARDGSGGGSLMQLRERLMDGECGYMIFPEGTRTRSVEMGRFKAGIGMLIAGTSVPVVPCFLKGTFEAWPSSRRFPRPGSVLLKVGSALTFAEEENNRLGWMRIAEKLKEAVCKLAE